MPSRTEHARQTKAATETAEATQTAEATEATEATEEAQGKAPAPAPESGGMQGALVTTTADADAEPNPMDTCDFSEDEDGQLSSVTFYTNDGQSVTHPRPGMSSVQVLKNLWQLVESGHRAHKKLKAVESSVVTSATLAMPALMEVDGVDLPDPQPIQWLSKLLPVRAREAIEGTYFLRIDEGTKDRHGNPYVPNMDENGRYTVPSTKDHPRKPGSLCSGKFPHAITQVKMGTKNKGKKPHYVCYASHKIELVVRLFKRTEDGREVAASESELLTKLSDAHKHGAQRLCGDLDDKMMLYLSLHQSNECGVSDVAPLGANAFKARSQGGHLLEPAESLPCTHNGGRPGWYEFEMERGVASISFHTRQRTTSANLKDSLKWDFFTFEVQALNPYLSKLVGFRVDSLPFRLKSVLHNDANSGERYVSKNGFTVISPPGDAR